MNTFRLAIVGGGPSCTYVLERLAATAPHICEPFRLEIHVFEKSGEFGSGVVHSPEQPASSFLNRIAGQVGFAADESVEGAGPLLDLEFRPTLYEWCRSRFVETGDAAFDMDPESWPKRRVHGLALQDAFNRYRRLLETHPSIQVYLHHAEVYDVQECANVFSIEASNGSLRADHILFLTGHSSTDPQTSETLRSWIDFAQETNATYVAHAYPLERMIRSESVAPGKMVGTVGMGLTAIDVIMYLTEGRGGRFEVGRAPGRLMYRASGAEPSGIVAFGNTGLFTFARPFNAKQRDAARLEHKPVFLTESVIDRLRESVGTPMEIVPTGVRRQLDFERDVLPLVLLEMAYIYYRTLLGADFGELLKRIVHCEYEAFLDGKARSATPEQAAASLLSPVEAAVTNSFAEIETALNGGALGDSRDEALRRYLFVVFGSEARLRRSPHGHAIYPEGNRFSWDRLIHPIPLEECCSPDRYRAALLAFMERDHLWAAQNNLDNPQKAATDGVWRDLRQVLAYAIDFGGLTARSHQKFLSVYMRHHNRLANGAALEVMQKIQALIDCRLLDVSVGPHPAIEVDASHQQFLVRGRLTGAERRVDTLVDARVHAFDPETDNSLLYRNMLRRGLIRKWRNPADDGTYFEPGGLALDEEFHPVRDGKADARMTFLGPPSEGVMFFQLGALRPDRNHHVMRDIVRWIGSFWNDAVRDPARMRSVDQTS